MPYKTISELPDSVKENLPKPAQEIYQDAFNNAWELYNEATDPRGDTSRDDTSHSVAWAAVQDIYEQNDTGKWRKKRISSGNGADSASSIATNENGGSPSNARGIDPRDVSNPQLAGPSTIQDNGPSNTRGNNPRNVSPKLDGPSTIQNNVPSNSKSSGSGNSKSTSKSGSTSKSKSSSKKK